MNNHLKSIIENKNKEINELKQSKIEEGITYSNDKSFKKILNRCPFFIIAEIKRKSPSKSVLSKIEDPLILAEQYRQGGADAISVLTDKEGFNGKIEDLEKVSKANLHLPLLRKDFILDPIQIDESILAGADAILLIVSILKEKTKTLFDYAKSRGIDAVIEIYDKQDLEYAISIGAEIILVNNRNLITFEVDTENAKRLIKYLPTHLISIAASGISNKALVQEYKTLGYQGVLIGEALVTHPDSVLFLKSLRALK